MMRKNKLTLSFLLAIILPFSSVYAQSLKEDGQRLNTGISKTSKLSMHALRAIDLSDEQRDDIRAITEAATSNLRQTTEELNEVRKSLQESVHTGNPDDSQLQSLSQELGDLTASLTYQQAQLQSGIFSILTEDQVEALSQLHEERGKGFRDRKRKVRDKSEI